MQHIITIILLTKAVSICRARP